MQGVMYKDTKKRVSKLIVYSYWPALVLLIKKSE